MRPGHESRSQAYGRQKMEREEKEYLFMLISVICLNNDYISVLKENSAIYSR